MTTKPSVLDYILALLPFLERIPFLRRRTAEEKEVKRQQDLDREAERYRRQFARGDLPQERYQELMKEIEAARREG